MGIDNSKFIVTTTGTVSPVNLGDIGFPVITHPATIDLLQYLNEEVVFSSKNLQDALDNGELVAVDERGALIDDVSEATVTFPAPKITSISIIDSSNQANVEIAGTGVYLSEDTGFEIITPTNVTINSFVQNDIGGLTVFVDASAKGPEPTISVRGTNYGKQGEIFDSLISSSQLEPAPPPFAVDLRPGVYSMTVKHLLADPGNILVPESGDVAERDATYGLIDKLGQQIWFKFLDVSTTIAEIAKISFIINYDKNNLYVGLGGADFDESTADDGRNEFYLDGQFFSRDFRNMGGRNVANNHVNISVNEDIVRNAPHRLEIDILNDTVKLYQVASFNEADWYLESAILIADLGENYLTSTFDIVTSTVVSPVIQFRGTGNNSNTGCLGFKVDYA